MDATGRIGVALWLSLRTTINGFNNHECSLDFLHRHGAIAREVIILITAKSLTMTYRSALLRQSADDYTKAEELHALPRQVKLYATLKEYPVAHRFPLIQPIPAG